LELEQRLSQWKSCCEKLLEIAEAQRQIVNSQTDDFGPFAVLTREWAEGQAEFERISKELIEWRGTSQFSVYMRDEIGPLLKRVNEVVQDTQSQLEGQFGVTGEVIKDTRDRRKLMNAYYGMNQDEGIAYYVDEKK